MRTIREKAEAKGISVEEMIRLDAEFILASDHPEAYQKYVQIRDYSSMILQDSMLLEKTKKEAAYYLLDVEEMVFIKAEEMANRPHTNQ
jgi:hypothetical protein